MDRLGGDLFEYSPDSRSYVERPGPKCGRMQDLLNKLLHVVQPIEVAFYPCEVILPRGFAPFVLLEHFHRGRNNGEWRLQFMRKMVHSALSCPFQILERCY